MAAEHTFSLEQPKFGVLYARCSCGWLKRLTGEDIYHGGRLWDEHRQKVGAKLEHQLSVDRNRDGEHWMWCGPHWAYRLDGSSLEEGTRKWEEHKRRTGDDCSSGW